MEQRYRWRGQLFLVFMLVVAVSGCRSAVKKAAPGGETAVPPTPAVVGSSFNRTERKISQPTETAAPAAPASPTPSSTPTAIPSPTATPLPTASPEAAYLYLRPLPGVPNQDWFIGNYVDVDRQPDSFADYRGGFMSYDQHTGLDFILADVDQADAGVPVLAVREGTVLTIRDGQNDREFSQDGGQLSNFIKIEHADGSTAEYKHLKKNSILVAPGEVVKAGQPIAQVGSSGLSSHPHLHLAVRDGAGQIVDLAAEGLMDLADVYPARPLLFDAGISSSSDPRIFSNYFRYTPAHRTSIAQGETLYVWYKLINMGPGDAVYATLVYPDGRQMPLFTIQTQDNRKFDSYFVYLDGLSPGYYRVLITLNEQAAPIRDLPFVVEN